MKTKQKRKLAARKSEAACSVAEVKPPLGIMPERIWKEHRAWELMKCLVRHESQHRIPGEWWYELRRLLAELGTPNAPLQTASGTRASLQAVVGGKVDQ